MDLSHLLRDLQMREGYGVGDPGQLPARPVVEVLSQAQDCLHGVCSSLDPRASILKDITDLFASGSSHWLFPDGCTDGDTDMVGVYVDLLSSLTSLAALPACETNCGDLPASSYAAIPDMACAVCAVLLTLVRRLGDVPHSNPIAHALAAPLFVFAVTHLQDQPWTTESSRRAATDLLDAVVQRGGLASVTQFLCGETADNHTGAFGAVLEMLKPELKKDTWKKNQATKHVFAWTLAKVGRPWLASFLEMVFPPSLVISDDYCTENKVLGVRCLHHIILSVPAADLRQYSRAQVLYHALFNHLYTAEAPLIEVALPCLLDLLSVLEKPCGSTEVPRKANRYDEVLRLVLVHMEMEHKLALRRVYAHNLPHFIHRMGITTVRHLKRLERVIVGYLEVSDGPNEQARLSILNALQETIQNAWPRVECRLAVLVRAVLRLLCDVAADPLGSPPAVREELLSKATDCLLLLDHCSEGRLRILLREVDSSCAHPSVFERIMKITGPPAGT